MTVAEKLKAGAYNNTKPFVRITKDEAAWEAYMDEEARIKDQLRVDLAAEHELVGHAKEPLLWRMAWDRGHASGLAEVASEYEGLVELIK